jgi:hypothetical protein
MRLPYQQIAMEVIELVAPELAITLDWTEEGAGWGIILLHKWALARCPDDLPPSSSDIVRGPNAAKLIARAARFTGDPDAFVAACVAASPAILERVEGGIRVRGLSRYDAAWGKSNPRKWAELRDRHEPEATPPRVRTDSDPVPERFRPESVPEPGRQTQIQTQIQIQKEAAAAAAADQFQSEFHKLRTEVLGDTVPADRPLKTKQVRRLQLVAAEHRADVLQVAAKAYFRDRHWRSQDPPCPLAGFIHPDQLPQFLSKAARAMPSEAA